MGLFWYFFRIGWFTFGGGWSIVAQIEKEYVEKRKELENQELLDMVGMGRSLPGTMIGNVAYLFGYHQCGVAGGVCSVLGIITPPLILLSILTLCYVRVKEWVWVDKALIGVRACVAPVIFSAMMKLWKSAFPEKACYLLCVIGCLASLVWKVNSVLLVVFGILAGLGIGAWKGGHRQ